MYLPWVLAIFNMIIQGGYVHVLVKKCCSFTIPETVKFFQTVCFVRIRQCKHACIQCRNMAFKVYIFIVNLLSVNLSCVCFLPVVSWSLLAYLLDTFTSFSCSNTHKTLEDSASFLHQPYCMIFRFMF